MNCNVSIISLEDKNVLVEDNVIKCLSDIIKNNPGEDTYNIVTCHQPDEYVNGNIPVFIINAKNGEERIDYSSEMIQMWADKTSLKSLCIIYGNNEDKKNNLRTVTNICKSFREYYKPKGTQFNQPCSAFLINTKSKKMQYYSSVLGSISEGLPTFYELLKTYTKNNNPQVTQEFFSQIM